jgi:nucleoside-diphosphate-sugar epimerase
MRSVVAVTGASGFIGQAVCNELLDRGFIVRAMVRAIKPTQQTVSVRLQYVAVGDLCAETDWTEALREVTCVVHCAGRAQVMNEMDGEESLATYRAINVASSKRLAEQAASSGVRRLVFLSSIKVNGECTFPLSKGIPPNGRPEVFKASDCPAPMSSYGQSKWEAEQVLYEVSSQSQLEVVILRPPLVYGHGVKANFATLLSAVKLGWPLPLGAVQNRRSLVALDNLVDLIVNCIKHPKAVNQTFLVSDGQDVSTKEIVEFMALAAGVTPRFLPVPFWVLQLGASLLGRRDALQRLCGNLQIDICKTSSLLDWVPPVSVQEGMRRCLTLKN